MTIALRPLPLAIIVMMLLAGVKTAGLVEALEVASPARASPPAQAEQAGKAPAAEPKPAVLEPAAPSSASEAPVSEAERAALQDLRARRTQLESRAARLEEREALLAAAERRLTDRVQQLSALQTKLEQLEKERHDREETNWRGLVKTYEAMRPRDAAVIFNDLESPVLLQVLDRMKETKAAPILAAMAPERARAATAQLAQWRNQVSAAPHLDAPDQGGKP
jgi:flagellar motility protein MotE (MotC chaperone)